MVRQYRRGDIFTVDFELVRGHEQGKVRPALVIQNDIGNQYSPTTIVAAITRLLSDPRLFKMPR